MRTIINKKVTEVIDREKQKANVKNYYSIVVNYEII